MATRVFFLRISFLFRFCAECIVTALRSGNKECPTCRKKLVSKRSLRPDPNFDQLVEKIFPNREEYEAHQESILDSISRSHSQNFITSIKDGIKAQMAHAKAVSKKKNNEDFPESPHHMPITGANRRDEDYEDSPLPPPKNKKKKIKPPTSLNSSINEDGAEDSGASGSATQEIEIVFKLHPEMTQDKEMVKAMKDNATRYIKTTSRALVEHLCKYLAMRIALDLANKNGQVNNDGSSGASQNPPENPGSSVKDLTIYIASVPGQLTPLTTTFSLTQVNEKYWKVNKPMEMFYSFKRV